MANPSLTVASFQSMIWTRINLALASGNVGSDNVPFGIFFVTAPDDTDPRKTGNTLVVFELEGTQDATSGEAFNEDGIEFLLTTYLMDKRDKGSGRVEVLADYLYGDSAPGSGTAPTYGLHRWVPTRANLTLTPVQHLRTDAGVQDNGEIVVYVDEWRFTAHRA